MARLMIDKDSEFFIAICKEPGYVHSFVIIGAYDKKRDANYILCGTGKYFNYLSTQPNCVFPRLAFATVPAHLRDESFLYKHSNLPLTYKAFSITLKQYQAYLDQLSHTTLDKDYAAYQLNGDESTEQDFCFDHGVLPQKEQSAAINKEVVNLGLKSTCRHTAKELLDSGLGQHYAGKDVPAFFLSNFRCHSTINKGELDKQLFIFPVPPSKAGLKPEVHKALSDLYKRMETISTSYQKNADSYHKFAALKKLYVKLDARKEMDVHTLFATINNWEKDHKNIIDARRGFSFWQTATRKTTNRIKRDLLACTRRPK